MSWTQNKPPSGTPLKPGHPQLDGLVGWWLFQEGGGDKAYDLSGNGNVGTLNNFAFPATVDSGWNPGKFGKTLAYDGSDDIVVIPDSPTLDLTTGMTVSFWFNTPVQNINDYMVSKCLHAPPYTYSYAAGITDESGKKLKYGVTTTGGSTTRAPVYTVAIDKWNHYVVTYDSGSGVLASYINGCVVESLALGGSGGALVPNSHSLDIGWLGTGVGAYNGLIDDVRIYNRALSAAEIQDIYSNPFAAFRIPQFTLDLALANNLLLLHPNLHSNLQHLSGGLM